MNGLAVASSAIVGFADPTNWTIRGTGDFGGDGKSDILWQDTSGNVTFWDMNGASISGSGLVGFADPSAWSIVATGDFEGVRGPRKLDRRRRPGAGSGRRCLTHRNTY
jgi:hypothetical protein